MLQVDTTDFTGLSGSVLATVTQTFQQDSSSGGGGGAGSWEQPVVLQTCVAVPGCVLILAQLASLGSPRQPLLQQSGGGGDAASTCAVRPGTGCCGSCRPAVNGGTWSIRLRSNLHC
jgi:hypothetical protein